ncbi:2-isopropylmalate synthase [Candidatus Micrarchaeota archaeon]|nr:2-isopropylmalate synthase [Candidatus Micrarchaeota archaeon]
MGVSVSSVPVHVFDTTLRDGEQSPGCSMTAEEKLIIARQLVRLNVDVIEAGFPVASNDDFDAVKRIAEEIRVPTIAALCRAQPEDITRGAKAIEPAAKPRIHTFIATSDIHLQHKLKMTKPEVLARVKEMVGLAKSHVSDVEFSSEDASRSDVSFLKQVVRTAVDAGATTINLPDTVGYAQPAEYGAMVRQIADMPECAGVTISVHCHDDLGLAVANSLSGIQNGARQVECTVNGIGERAGNASLEEVVMNLKTRPRLFHAHTNVVSQELFRTSRLVAELTGSPVQRNKAIVGANAFAHEAGIHQHGVLANRMTYEIMAAGDVGWKGEDLVIGKHSGKHAIHAVLSGIGIELAPDQLREVVEKVKELGDKQKDVGSDDVIGIAEDVMQRGLTPAFSVLDYVAVTGDKVPATATIKLFKDGTEVTTTAHGIGVVDATFSALTKVLPIQARLQRYSLEAITGGSNALAAITVVLEDESGRKFRSRAVHEDIVLASLKALVNGYNKVLVSGEKNGRNSVSQRQTLHPASNASQRV